MIKTEKPLFGEGEDPSLIDCSTSQIPIGSDLGATAGAAAKKVYAKRSDQFAHLEEIKKQMQEESKRA